jgi:hypothetical protein
MSKDIPETILMASGAQKQDISQQKYIEVQDKNNKKKGK